MDLEDGEIQKEITEENVTIANKNKALKYITKKIKQQFNVAWQWADQPLNSSVL